jgi:cytidylate kinase
MIIFFRGKAATGKSSLAKEFNNRLGLSIIHKDNIFDRLLLEGCSWSEANKLTYERLASNIQEYHDREENLIVDIGLAHTEYFLQFLSKMNLLKKNTEMFLFTCDEKVWEDRILKRIKNPDGPNQAFKSIEEAKSHYNKYSIVALENEIELNSTHDVKYLYDVVLKSTHINLKR